MSDGLANGYDMRKLPLERGKKLDPRAFPWKSCAPFVENSRGILIHRPRTGNTYNIHRTGPHVGLGFWCGMHISSDGKNLTFLSAPPEGRILCERCEAIAVANGLPSADELAGRHVHKGGVVAVVTCCNIEVSGPEAASSPEGRARLLGSASLPEPTFERNTNGN